MPLLMMLHVQIQQFVFDVFLQSKAPSPAKRIVRYRLYQHYVVDMSKLGVSMTVNKVSSIQTLQCTVAISASPASLVTHLSHIALGGDLDEKYFQQVHFFISCPKVQILTFSPFPCFHIHSICTFAYFQLILSCKNNKNIYNGSDSFI
jgi:hypothetical protein